MSRTQEEVNREGVTSHYTRRVHFAKSLLQWKRRASEQLTRAILMANVAASLELDDPRFEEYRTKVLDAAHAFDVAVFELDTAFDQFNDAIDPMQRESLIKRLDDRDAKAAAESGAAAT